MKMKLAKFCLGLTLGALTLSGCGGGSGDNPFGGGENPFGGGGGGAGNDGVTNGTVQTYTGDKSRTVGTITDRPVTQYNAATTQKINGMLSYLGSFSDTTRNEFVDCLLSLKIGDNLASAICDFVTRAESFAHTEGTTKYLDSIVDYSYDALKILNSVDFDNAVTFMNKINEIRLEHYLESGDGYTEYENIRDYLAPSLDGSHLSYKQYKGLKKLQDKVNNVYLDDILADYSFYDTFIYTNTQSHSN